MPLPSNEEQLETICTELQVLSLRRQQLNDRLSLLSLLKDFRKNAGLHEEDLSGKEEYEEIEEELNNLTEKKKELQRKKDELEGGTFRIEPSDGPATPSSFGSKIFFVEKPPAFPAPQVILDVQKLPPRPSPTQCPYCHQYITTEITAISGSTTWLVCLVCTCICCVAGCCLIPFCINAFKDVVHKCPKCRSQIHRCKKL